MASTELLFPPRLIAILGDQRGKKWEMFLNGLQGKQIGEAERRAFVLMMARLAGCVTCQSDTWRAHQGCEQCAKQTLRKFRGTDEDLIQLFESCLMEIQASVSAEIDQRVGG